jgi:hypothetical protein
MRISDFTLHYLLLNTSSVETLAQQIFELYIAFSLFHVFI